MSIAFIIQIGNSDFLLYNKSLHFQGVYEVCKGDEMRKLKKWVAMLMCASMLVAGAQSVMAASSEGSSASDGSATTSSDKAINAETAELTLPSGG